MQKSLKEAIEPAEPDDEDLPMPAPLIEEEESAEILDVLALHMSMKGVDSYERGDVGSETQLSRRSSKDPKKSSKARKLKSKMKSSKAPKIPARIDALISEDMGAMLEEEAVIDLQTLADSSMDY